jgi:hypothetical protein
MNAGDFYDGSGKISAGRAFGVEGVPFESAEEAWFWFMAAQEAGNEGARLSAGSGLYPRPCEPVDILKVLDRLYRQRRLLRDHLLVLRHYGLRHMAPDPCRPRERKARRLWDEALERIGSVLESKGILCPPERFEPWVFQPPAGTPSFSEGRAWQ